jgi:uncharacterized protein
MSAMQGTGRQPNHLVHEKSPYLRQHASNPVNWYPWDSEAFHRAMEEDKPVFVSIGYATCHWCHVMAHESFEDETVASVLNEHFIAVKVDREERPDIDGVYMTVCQLMTGQGGWPLTVVLTPQKEPFFAGTYFSRSGLVNILSRIATLWKELRSELQADATRITSALREPATLPRYGEPDDTLLMKGFEELQSRFDPVNGGFGTAPKFPTPSILLFLLRYYHRTGSAPALQMVERTLDALNCGGIHDHLGGGFHRYSTDAAWQVPHFEKMLYDQALLLMAFTEGWLATQRPEYQKTAEAIITYVLRDLASNDGAFLSAEDADSPGGEGAFYTWTREEIDRILGKEDGAFAADLFGITGTGNFRIPETGRNTNILSRKKGSCGAIISENNQDCGDESLTDTIRERLFFARNSRPRPGRDDKVLSDWNGLFITALVRAYCAFGNQQHLEAAKRAMHFILTRLRAPDGGLFHRYCDDEAAIPAFADDYAFLIQALISLYEADFDPGWLEDAITLDHYLADHFHDAELDGYFSVSDFTDPVLLRKKEVYDGAIPSGNSVILGNLVLLGHLTGDFRYHERASLLARGLSGLVGQSPSAYTGFLSGLDLLLGPVTDIVIVGDEQAPETRKMIALLREMYLPSVTLLYRIPGNPDIRLDTLAPFTTEMVASDGNTTAYICKGTTCSEPVTGAEDLRNLLLKPD